MATFEGNAAGYRLDFLPDGKIRVVDIDASNGDTGKRIISGEQFLHFADQSHKLELLADSQVNTTSRGPQFDSAITALADGGYVVTWQSSDGSGSCVCAQRYDAAGNAMGAETRINASIAGDQGGAGITALADGGYVVTWTSVIAGSSMQNVYLQRFDAAGNAVGGETLVNTATLNDQFGADVAALADGGYIVTWTSDGEYGSNQDIRAQRYDAAGNAVGGEVLVNTATAGDQSNARIEALPDGGYVIAWDSWGQDGDNSGIYAQRYDAAGNAVGGEMRLNTTTVGAQSEVALAVLADGSVVFTWFSWQDGSGIYIQRFDAAGDASGGETRVNTSALDWHSPPAVAALADGGCVITWTASDRGQSGIYAQRYDATGNAVGAEMRINSFMDGFQSDAAVTALANGGYVITGTSSSQDGSSLGVCARYFDANGDSTPTGITLTGSDANDIINGGTGMHFILGRGGNDVLNGGDGKGVLYGGDGDDVLSGGHSLDRLYGGSGNDALTGGAGKDYMQGGAGDDAVDGGEGNDEMRGGSGNNTMMGGAGNDYLAAAGGDDVMDGGDGADELFAGAGDNVLHGGTGNDVLKVTAGDSVLDGGAGDDFLAGGAGDNTLIGGTGRDHIIGGRGSDTFVFSSKLGAVDVFSDFSSAENDAIQLENAVFTSLAAVGALGAGNFAANADGAAQDANDYIVYETDTGKLFFDADGNGAGEKIQFAVIGNRAALTAADFEVI